MSEGVLVFVILTAAFVAVGIHLFLWSRRVTGRIRRFAGARGLKYEARDRGSLEARVNTAVALDESGLTRRFGQVGDLVRLPGGVLFRAVEFRDLNPHASSGYGQHARTAVLFDAPAAPAGIFSVTPLLEVRQEYPFNQSSAGALQAYVQQARLPRPPAPLSLTFMRGQALAYLEPFVSGSLTDEHLEYLAALPDLL